MTSEALLKCQKKHEVDDDATKDLMNFEKISDAPNVKCMAACWMEELNVLKDKKFNQQVITDLANRNLIDEEARRKGIEGYNKCIGEDLPEEICQLGYEVSSCFIEFIKKNNLQKSFFFPK